MRYSPGEEWRKELFCKRTAQCGPDNRVPVCSLPFYVQIHGLYSFVCVHVRARGRLWSTVLSSSVCAPGWLGPTGLAAPTLLPISPLLVLLPDVEQLKHLIIHLLLFVGKIVLEGVGFNT